MSETTIQNVRRDIIKEIVQERKTRREEVQYCLIVYKATGGIWHIYVGQRGNQEWELKEAVSEVALMKIEDRWKEFIIKIVSSVSNIRKTEED